MEVNRTLNDGWPSCGLLHIYLMEFCQVQHSYCIQVLRSPIFTALLHGTPVVYVSQTLHRVTRKGIRELLLLVCTTYILRGGRHVRHQPTL